MRLHFSRTPRTSAETGFTLIELMIVVAIIGILAAIAYPSYQDQVRKGRRAGAQSLMQSIATKEEQYLVESRVYSNDITALGLSATDINPFYTITITINALGTPPTYLVTAAAIGAQAADGNLTLDYRGVKTPAAKWK